MGNEVAQENVMAHNGGNAEHATRWEWVHSQAALCKRAPRQEPAACRGGTWLERQLIEETHSTW